MNNDLKEVTQSQIEDMRRKLAANTFRWLTWMGDNPRENTPWNDAEDAEVVIAYKAGASITQLSKRHGRRTGGIDSRLGKLLGDNYISEKKNAYEIDNLKAEILTLRKRINTLELSASSIFRATNADRSRYCIENDVWPVRWTDKHNNVVYSGGPGIYPAFETSENYIDHMILSSYRR